jgi:tetratricopeptide (TPR) repeat protein
LGRSGDFTAARAHYDRVLESNISSFFSSVDQGILGFKTLHNRSEMDMAMGNYAEAKAGWMAALEQAPTFLVSAVTLFDAALSMRDLPTAREMIDRVGTVEGCSDTWTQMTVRFGEAHGGGNTVADLLVSAFETNPRAFAPRMEYVRRLLAGGQDGAAIPHLHFLEERGVAEAAFVLGVIETKQRRPKQAMVWMERALVLNPGHEDTLKHVAMLSEVISQQGKASLN